MKAGNTQPPHTYIAEAACATHFLLHILAARLLKTLYISVHTHIFWITKAGNTAPHTYSGEAAYAVHFFQRGYSAHPQILNYEGRKHTATHTYTGATAYTVHFLQ